MHAAVPGRGTLGTDCIPRNWSNPCSRIVTMVLVWCACVMQTVVFELSSATALMYEVDQQGDVMKFHNRQKKHAPASFYMHVSHECAVCNMVKRDMFIV